VPSTQYRTAKREALEFSLRTDPTALLTPGAVAVCVVCGHILTEDDGPQTHHGIITKGDGIHLDVWWNLFPVCDDTCHRELEHHDTWDGVMLQHYYHISALHLGDRIPQPIRGYLWLKKRIEALPLKQHVELPKPVMALGT